ncbi:MAG: glycosyltransferase family 39 protein [Deltaproteobacteria bacterium]|nr:glycosyltransferase family 39 protein [Deltaproteobacteria bacterium]
MTYSKTTDRLSSPHPDNFSPAIRTVRVVLSLLILATVIYVGLLDLVPPWEKDELIHHLAIPQLWVKAGHFVETPWAVFSYYPMNVDLLYTIPLILNIDVIAHFIHHGFGLLTAWLIFLFLRRHLNSTWGLLGALSFISIPLVMRLSASAYVDLGLTFFVTAGIMALIRWRETNQWKYFIISASAIGLALGTKYQGAIILPLLSPVVFFISLQRAAFIEARFSRFGRAVGWTAIWLAIAGVIFAPWAIKNLILTGNPFFPLLNSWFGLGDIIPPELKITTIVQRNLLYGESWLDYLLIPFRFFLQGQDHDPRFFDGVLNPFLLFLPVLALIKPRTAGTGLLAVISAVWILTLACLGGTAVRYIAPVLPALVILSCIGLFRLHEVLTIRGRIAAARLAVLLITAAMLAFNASYTQEFWRGVDPGPYLTGRESRDQYLARKLDFYPAIQFINKSLPDTSRILLLFAGDRGYYFRRNYVFKTWFSGEMIQDILARSSSAEEAKNIFKQLKTTHIMANDQLLTSYLSGLADQNVLARWRYFQSKCLESQFAERGFTVYRIKE